jgi:hypothetical protein
MTWVCFTEKQRSEAKKNVRAHVSDSLTQMEVLRAFGSGTVGKASGVRVFEHPSSDCTIFRHAVPV